MYYTELNDYSSDDLIDMAVAIEKKADESRKPIGLIGGMYLGDSDEDGYQESLEYGWHIEELENEYDNINKILESRNPKFSNRPKFSKRKLFPKSSRRL
jgi:hypothetical protein